MHIVRENSKLFIICSTVAPNTPVIIGNTSYFESEDAVLECQVSTYPPPTIVWVKRDESVGTVVLNSQRSRINFTYNTDGPTAVSRLRISRVTTSDNGTYLCQVSTDIPGFSMVSNQVTVTIEGTKIQEYHVDILNCVS